MDGNVMNSATEEPETTQRRWPLAKIVLVGGVLCALVVLLRFLDIEALIAWVEGLGTKGMVLFVVLYAVACVFLVPGLPLTLGGGAAYGLGMGFALVSLGSTLGATITFIIARYIARDRIAQKMAGNKSFEAMDEAVAQQGWKIVFLTRLSPLFPFNLQNYGYGLTKVSLPHYVLASWIGMMPGTVLYVYFGALGIDVAEGGDSLGGWVMKGLMLVATILVTVVITRMAKKALSEAVDTDEASENEGVQG